MRKLFSLYGALLTCLLSLTAPHVSAAYLVDMIIFEPTSTQGWLDEYWPLLPSKLDIHEKDSLLGVANNHRMLTEGQGGLKEAAKRLTSTGEYRILAQIAWSQPTEDRADAYTTRLPEGLSSTGLSLQANVKLYKQKFEHIELEAQVERPIPKGLISEFAQKHNLSVSDVGNTWRFRLQESRKVKPNELQYFDHPMFGVLMMVRESGT